MLKDTHKFRIFHGYNIIQKIKKYSKLKIEQVNSKFQVQCLYITRKMSQDYSTIVNPQFNDQKVKTKSAGLINSETMDKIRCLQNFPLWL